MISPRLIRSLCLGLLLAFACGGLSGCAAWESLKGPSGQAENPEWSQNMRPANSAGRPTGLSQQALDIERNLGFQ